MHAIIPKIRSIGLALLMLTGLILGSGLVFALLFLLVIHNMIPYSQMFAETFLEIAMMYPFFAFVLPSGPMMMFGALIIPGHPIAMTAGIFLYMVQRTIDPFSILMMSLLLNVIFLLLFIVDGPMDAPGFLIKVLPLTLLIDIALMVIGALVCRFAINLFVSMKSLRKPAIA